MLELALVVVLEGVMVVVVVVSDWGAGLEPGPEKVWIYTTEEKVFIGSSPI